MSFPPTALIDLDVEYTRFNALRTVSDARPSRFAVDQEGPLTVVSDAARDDAYYNRILGLDESSLSALDSALERVAGRPAVRVDVAGGAPVAVTEALTQRGFESGPRLTWLHAATRDEPPSVRVTCWGPAERDRLVTLLELEGPVDPVIWAARRELYASDRFRVFVIEVDGELVAMGTTFIGAQGAILGNAVTHPDHRRRGYQGALITARLADAHDLGLASVVTDVEPETTSLRNGLRLGFGVICEQVHWERRQPLE